MRIGVDLGGTKVEVIALDDTGRTLARRRAPTPPDDYARVVGVVSDLVHAVEAELGETGTVGVGMPGALCPATGLIKNANSTWLMGHAFDRDLAGTLAREVRLCNDANCFALSEAVDGAGAGAKVVFGVILGTGVGGGIAIDAVPLTGCNAIAGEWGHNPLPAPDASESPGPDCYCGRRGCVETFLSGPALEREYLASCGREASATAIARMADGGDGDAETCMRRYEDRLARALAQVINVLDPDVIVLGGGLSNIERLYAGVPALWRPHVFSGHIDTRLLPPKFGDSSGARGAAWLWPAR